MKKLYFFLSLIGMFTLSLGMAKQKSVSGTVLDETGGPLPGATILVEGSNRGVTSDFDGNFSIQAAEGEVLVVSYVGYADQQITVGSQDRYSISLVTDNALGEVVVTSLGIKREAAQLGYAISKVDNEKVTNQPDADIGKLLRGKAAGVNITSNSIQNPRWTVENAKTRNKVDRFFGNVSLMYNLQDNLNISYRYGIDTYNEIKRPELMGFNALTN